jgi:hypothetical protein
VFAMELVTKLFGALLLELVSTGTRPTDGADYRCACNNKCHPAGRLTGVACGHGDHSGRKPAQRGWCRERLGQEAFSWKFSRFEPMGHFNPAGAARSDLRKIGLHHSTRRAYADQRRRSFLRYWIALLSRSGSIGFCASSLALTGLAVLRVRSCFVCRFASVLIV